MATGYVLPVGVQQFFDDDGEPLVGGKVYTYAAGTSTPLTTYSDSAMLIPNANPVVLDASGRATIYIAEGVGYKILVKTSAGVLVWTADNVSYPTIGTPAAPSTVETGTILDFGDPTPTSGYLTCDGSAVSRTVYAALFAVIGTTYGTGDGATTFNLPNQVCRMRLAPTLAKVTNTTSSTAFCSFTIPADALAIGGYVQAVIGIETLNNTGGAATAQILVQVASGAELDVSGGGGSWTDGATVRQHYVMVWLVRTGTGLACFVTPLSSYYYLDGGVAGHTWTPTFSGAVAVAVKVKFSAASTSLYCEGKGACIDVISQAGTYRMIKT